MAEKESLQVNVLDAPTHDANGKNGTNGSKSRSADSIYFKVSIPKQIIKRDGRIVSFDPDRI
ncbi:MAG: hypothetical protein GWP17_04385, partial [Aquificales bacterium]|nr:hypothetical protein [Aquificales bacterium]